MFSRALRRGFTSGCLAQAPRRALVPASSSPSSPCLIATTSPRRRVTTDAASSHAEREKVPKEDDKPFEVVLSDESFETYELDPPSYYLDTTKTELKKMYYDMVSVR